MERLLTDYFSEIDSSLGKLSQGSERLLPGMQSWVLCNREITVGQVGDGDFYVIKVLPRKELEKDELQVVSIGTDSELDKFVKPWSAKLSIQDVQKMSFTMLGDSHMTIGKGQLNASTVPLFQGLLIFVPASQMTAEFSIEKAKRQALDLWNNATHGLQKDPSFSHNLRVIFEMFSRIVKRKAFLERRIHRYINSYPIFLLPSFKTCYFEHTLFLKGDRRVADFILERGAGLPAMLIELESPSSRLFTKKNELTAQANHAKNQIAEWVRFIDENPDNTQGEMNFLQGTKQRLVVMGRGLENLEEMVNSRYTDTIMWTYDLLAKEAKETWNAYIVGQCNLLGISNPNLLT